MKDILKTLRELCYGHTHSASRQCHIASAADEIEKLRNDLSFSDAKYIELLHDYLDLKFKTTKQTKIST